ncbi:MAG: hypothetical protein AB9915_00030 [Candidatus Dojkabacteria bacterium]
MPRSKKNVSTKKTAPKVEKKAFSLKKVKFVISKPDLTKLKGFNYKPVLKIVGLIVIIIGSFTLIDLAVQYLNNDYSVAVVDGARISKAKWHDRLEKAYGAAVAQELIEDEVLKMEAKKTDVSVSKEDIDTQIDEIRTSIGGEEQLQAALVANNINMNELRDQIELDTLYTKILTPTLTYTENDVKDFFNQYSDVIFPDETAALEEGEKLDFEANKAKTEEVYVQQQVQTKKTTWLAEKKVEYKIQDNSSAKPKYGFLTTTTNIIKNIVDSFNENK